MKPSAIAWLLIACASPASVEVAHEPAAPLLELRVLAPEEGAPLVLEVENRGPRPIPIGGARARVEVRRDGQPLPECDASASSYVALSEDDTPLAPRELRRFEVPLPCALDAPGAYALLVELALNGGSDPFVPNPSADQLAASAQLYVAPRVARVETGTPRRP